MWSIEVSQEASEEEIDEALLEAVDFDHIRESVTRLRDVVEKYGPFKEVKERSEDSHQDELVRTYHERRGWICDELEKVNGRKVWTYLQDPVNNYSYLMSGYKFTGIKEKPSRHEIQSWFVSDKPYENLEDLTVNTEFIIMHFFTDSDDDDGEFYSRLDLWNLVESDDLSDRTIIGVMSS